MKLETRFGKFGGMYIPETLVAPLGEIEAGFADACRDARFNEELSDLLRNYAGRETPLYFARNLSEQVGRRVYLKREDLLHGGAHKTNNTIGQGVLARRLGKRRIIAETGAGQHGVATAMAGALLKIPVEIYMGEVDIERQRPNVQRMELFGATVHPVSSGSATLKDAINEALRDWIAHADDTYYLFGTAAGPHPFPRIVRHFQSVIGTEARAQIIAAERRLPDAVFACVGGGSNAIGVFSGFISDESVTLIGAEAAGEGLHTGRHAATLGAGCSGVFHGMHSFFLQNDDGQILETHSVAAGLDYPGVGPEHVYLMETGRATYLGVTDEEALAAFGLLARTEGILGAMESCHALSLALKEAENFPPDSVLLVNLSGRGDKDLDTYLKSVN